MNLTESKRNFPIHFIIVFILFTLDLLFLVSWQCIGRDTDISIVIFEAVKGFIKEFL
jgi:NADH:ubiquinone oxidoreductase subunit 3 (subunit A)